MEGDHVQGLGTDQDACCGGGAERADRGAVSDFADDSGQGGRVAYAAEVCPETGFDVGGEAAERRQLTNASPGWLQAHVDRDGTGSLHPGGGSWVPILSVPLELWSVLPVEK